MKQIDFNVLSDRRFTVSFPDSIDYSVINGIIDDVKNISTGSGHTEHDIIEAFHKIGRDRFNDLNQTKQIEQLRQDSRNKILNRPQTESEPDPIKDLVLFNTVTLRRCLRR